MKVMSKKKPAPGRARDRGDTTTFTFEMEPALDAALEECGRLEERTKKAILTLALKAYLQDRKLWPRPPSPGE